MDVAEGTLIAGYRIERRLDGDETSTMYLARHPRLPRRDVVKVLSEACAKDAAFRARFLSEAETAVRVQHPNVVAVRDCGVHEDRWWIAMQYVDGVDAGSLVARGRTVLYVERAVRIVTEAARGLDEIHRKGLLHLDVKPANIAVVEQRAEPDRVWVADFGVARPRGDATTRAEVDGRSLILACAAPEQISGGEVDDRADVYSLGCTLFHLLTGSAPFDRDSPGAVISAHLNDAPPRPSVKNPLVPVAMDAVIAKALAKKPEDRFPSCGALARAASSALSPDPSPISPTGTRAGTNGGGRRRLLLVVAVVLAALAAVLASATYRAGRADDSASPSPVSTTGADPAAVAAAAAWSPHAALYQAFPNLLPATPLGLGYQGLNTCRFVDYTGDPVAFDVVDTVDRLECAGDQDPAFFVDISCNTARTPIAPAPASDIERLEGEERWTRPTGTGLLRWGTYLNATGRDIGALQVSFDDPGRSFCRIQVVGDASGSELRARWWLDAPL
ncbi:serine/threonine-protein kinase [Nocardia aurea]|uniref:non-specific serine/threonine protein kinase n=1 Tax=Nocardia aurea TaxID=2144174 RepID=A0ABV3FY23_9NOCA